MNRDTVVQLIFAAGDIPSNSTVTMVKGTKPYTLKHNLMLYQDTKGEQPVKIEGLFIVGQSGDIKQIAPDKQLALEMTIDDLADWIEREAPDYDPDDGK